METSRINTSGLRRYLKHLALVSNRHHEREEAHDSLRKQIGKLKASALGKKTKVKIMAEFEELEDMISLVLEKEQAILDSETGNPQAYRKILKEIEDNRKEIMELNKVVTQQERKIKNFDIMKLERELRLKDLEKKIKSVHKKRKELPALSNKLMLLETKYNEMKDNPSYNRKDLHDIKFKIDSLKVKAAVSNF
ncbi:MAG: hypothetical protein ABIJ08_03900 [Nanoarchaeota archaeon]